MKTKLTIDIIRNYGFEETTYKPDWDDVAVKFELPNGITLSGHTVCGNEPCKTDMLEGMDGFVCIESKEELDALLDLKTYEDVLESLATKYDDFDIEEFL